MFNVKTQKHRLRQTDIDACECKSKSTKRKDSLWLYVNAIFPSETLKFKICVIVKMKTYGTNSMLKLQNMSLSLKQC